MSTSIVCELIVSSCNIDQLITKNIPYFTKSKKREGRPMDVWTNKLFPPLVTKFDLLNSISCHNVVRQSFIEETNLLQNM